MHPYCQKKLGQYTYVLILNENGCSVFQLRLNTKEAGQKTYAHLAELAKDVLQAGFSVIVDAAFLKVEQRNLFRQLAEELKIKFIIIDFQAAEETLCNRITLRQNDPSEATIDVLHQQMQSEQPLSDDEKKHAITINTEIDNVEEKLLKSLLIRPFNVLTVRVE
jgi:predicted kinase